MRLRSSLRQSIAHAVNVMRQPAVAVKKRPVSERRKSGETARHCETVNDACRVQCPRIRSRQVRTVYIFSRWGAEQPLPVQDGDRDFGRPGSILLEKGADRLGSVLLEKGADRPGVYTPKSGEPSCTCPATPSLSLSLSYLPPLSLCLCRSLSL